MKAIRLIAALVSLFGFVLVIGDYTIIGGARRHQTVPPLPTLVDGI